MNNSRQDDSDFMINIPAEGGPKSNFALGAQKAVKKDSPMVGFKGTELSHSSLMSTKP